MGGRSHPNGGVSFRKGRPCSICHHPSRAEIEEAVAAYLPYRRISERYDVSIAAISRHIRTHVAEELLAMLRERVAAHRERELAAFLGPELMEFVRADAERLEELSKLVEGGA